MTILERIKETCRKKKNISITTLEQELGYSNGSLSKAKDIPGSRILGISKFLGVSTDFILTGEESLIYQLGEQDAILTSLDEKVIEYAIKLNSLSKDNQEHIMEHIDFLCKKDK